MAMWSALRRLFADDPPAAPTSNIAPMQAASAPAQEVAARSEPKADVVALDTRAFDRRFSAHLFGCGSLADTPISVAEQQTLDRLASILKQGVDPAIVPRLPALLPKLMGLVRREDTSTREVADLIGRDPALVGEVVRLSNSAHYRSGRKITDLPGAVMVLGQLGLAQLVSRIAMRPIFSLDQGRFGRSAGAQLWDLAERCSHGCAWLRAGREDAYSAFLAGTVAHIGLLAAVRVLDQTYAAPEPPRSLAFHDRIWQLGQSLSLLVARDWGFPEDVLETLAHRAAGDDQRAASPLSAALSLADRAARVHLLTASDGAQLPEFAHDALLPLLHELERCFDPEKAD